MKGCAVGQTAGRGTTADGSVFRSDGRQKSFSRACLLVRAMERCNDGDDGFSGGDSNGASVFLTSNVWIDFAGRHTWDILTVNLIR